MAKHRSDQEWASILSAYHRSGLTQAAFCRRFFLTRDDRGGSGASRELPPGSGELLEIPLPGSLRDGLPAAVPGHEVPVEIEFPGGARASLAVQPGVLADLLAELHRLPSRS